jgi:hypothetical protein
MATATRSSGESGSHFIESSVQVYERQTTAGPSPSPSSR